MAAFLDLSQVCFDLRDMDASRAALERALELDPLNAQAHNGLACVLGALGCVDEQRAALETALALDPGRSTPVSLAALNNLALLERESGHPLAAAQALETLLDRAPTMADQRELYAIVLSEMGRPDHALVQMEIALAATPTFGARWLELAKHALVAGELEQSLEALQVARSLDPDLPDLDAMEEQVRRYLGR